MVATLIRIDPGFRLFVFGAVMALGLTVGSFLNVCIYRMPRGIPLGFKRSHCPNCGSTIPWHDNVPVLAWLIWLRGRCRFCGAPIAARYPTIELLTGLLYLLVFWRFGWQPMALSMLLLASALVVATFIDLDHLIIPNEISVGGLPAGIALAVAGWLGPVDWRQSVIGMGLGLSIPLAVSLGYYAIRRREGIGLGDVKLLGTLGAFLGWKGALFSLIAGSTIGSMAAFALLLAGRARWSRRLPFGPSLAVGAMLYVLAGPWLVQGYWRLAYMGWESR